MEQLSDSIASLCLCHQDFKIKESHSSRRVWMWYRDSLALITDVTLNSPIFLSCLFLKVGVNPPIKLNRGFDKATARSKNFNRALMLNAVSRCHSVGTKVTAVALYSDTAADQNVAERSSDASIRGFGRQR